MNVELSFGLSEGVWMRSGWCGLSVSGITQQRQTSGGCKAEGINGCWNNPV